MSWLSARATSTRLRYAIIRPRNPVHLSAPPLSRVTPRTVPSNLILMGSRCGRSPSSCGNPGPVPLCSSQGTVGTTWGTAALHPVTIPGESSLSVHGVLQPSPLQLFAVADPPIRRNEGRASRPRTANDSARLTPSFRDTGWFATGGRASGPQAVSATSPSNRPELRREYALVRSIALSNDAEAGPPELSSCDDPWPPVQVSFSKGTKPNACKVRAKTA